MNLGNPTGWLPGFSVVVTILAVVKKLARPQLRLVITKSEYYEPRNMPH